MAITTNQGARIYWDEQGQGDPVLLILIAGCIDGAKLVMIQHASHVLATDQPEAVNQAVLEFLSAQSSQPPRFPLC